MVDDLAARQEGTPYACSTEVNSLQPISVALEQAYTTVPGALVCLDTTGIIFFLNRNACDMVGYESAASIGKEFASHLLPERHRALFSSELAKLLTATSIDSTPKAIDLDVLSSDGDEIPVEITLSAVSHRNGRPAYAIGLICKMALRRHAEAELQQSLAYARSLIEADPNPWCIVDVDGIITDVNKATEAITGLPRDILIGSHFVEIVVDPASALIGFQQTLANGFIKDFPCAIRHTSGRVANILLNGTIYKDQAGNIKGVLGSAYDVTSQMERDQELKALATIIEDCQDGVASYGKDLICTSWNKACETIYGYTKEEMIGQSILKLRPQESQEQMRANIDRLFKGESLKQIQAEHRRKDGKLITVSLTLSATKDASGNIVEASGICRDVTETVMREQNSRRLADIVDCSDDAIFSWRSDSICTSWNKGAEKVFGYTAEEMIGQTVFILIPEENKNEVIERIRLLQSGQQIGHFKAVRLRKDGSRVIVSTSHSPITDQTGAVVGFSTIVRDITEQEQLSKKLIESEEYFRQICSGARDAVICIDDQGSITVWNAAAEMIFGHRCEEVVGQMAHTIVLPERYHQLYLERFARLKNSGSGSGLRKTITLDACRANGVEFPIELSMSAVQIRGQWHGIGLIRDISERKRIEDDLRNSQGALMAERDAVAIVNEQLKAQAAILQSHSNHMELLTQMAELLQLAETEEEAYSILARSISQLFPDSSGGLFVPNESTQNLDRIGIWGDGCKDLGAFAADDCWALRRGQPHTFTGIDLNPLCSHVKIKSKYMCIPMTIQGQMFGLLHLHCEQLSQDEQKLAIRVIADAAMSLSNLKLQQQLKNLSVRDPLTGLFNRRYMEEFFEQELVRSKRKGTPLSVLMLDIDYFKQFNDKFGHAAGDLVLRELSATLASNVRGNDVVCRYGGEEFILPIAGMPNRACDRTCRAVALACQRHTLDAR